MDRKKIFLLIICLILITVIFQLSNKVLYRAGEYTGIGQGHNGQIKVVVVTGKYKIKEIKIIEEQETPVLRDLVFEKIPPKVMKKNSTDVDGVSGATNTSKGLLEAIEDGLKKAKIFN